MKLGDKYYLESGTVEDCDGLKQDLPEELWRGVTHTVEEVLECGCIVLDQLDDDGVPLKTYFIQPHYLRQPPNDKPLQAVDTGSAYNCEDCKDTGRIKLFTSTVKCDCRKRKR